MPVESRREEEVKAAIKHPFLRAFDKNKRTRKVWNVDNFIQAASEAMTRETQNELLTQRANKKLTRAKDTHLRDYHQPGRHKYEERKRMCELFLAYYGLFDDDLIKEVSYDLTDDESYGQLRLWVMSCQGQSQYYTISYFTEAVQTFVDMTGGVKIR